MSSEPEAQNGKRPMAMLNGIALFLVLLIGALSFGIARWTLDTPMGDDPEKALAAKRQQMAEKQEDLAQSPEAQRIMAELNGLRDSLKNDPSNAELMLSYANRLYDAQLYKPASVVYEKYLTEIDSTNPDARIDYAFTLFQQGDTDMALAETKRALDYRKDHPIALFNIGIIHLNLRNPDEAKGWFERCIAVAGGERIGAKAREIVEMINSGALK